jgi:hypothetical protein
VNLNNDLFNCGKCGAACAVGQVCAAGTCQQAFPSPSCGSICSASCCGSEHMCCLTGASAGAHVICVAGTQCPSG